MTLSTPTGTPPDRDGLLTEAEALAKRVGLRALADGKTSSGTSAWHQRAVETWVDTYKRADYSSFAIFVEMGIEESVRRSEEEHRRDHERYRRARVTAVGISPPEAIQALADITTEATLHVGAAATAMGLPRFDGQDVRQKRAKPTMGGGVGGGAGAAAEVTGLVSSYVTGELTLNVLTQRFGPGSGLSSLRCARPA